MTKSNQTHQTHQTEQPAEHLLDTQGLNCPEPVMLLHRAIRKAQGGERIEVLATDPATTRDIPNFCRHLGHELMSEQQLDNTDDATPTYRYVIQKRTDAS